MCPTWRKQMCPTVQNSNFPELMIKSEHIRYKHRKLAKTIYSRVMAAVADDCDNHAIARDEQRPIRKQCAPLDKVKGQAPAPVFTIRAVRDQTNR